MLFALVMYFGPRKQPLRFFVHWGFYHGGSRIFEALANSVFGEQLKYFSDDLISDYFTKVILQKFN